MNSYVVSPPVQPPPPLLFAPSQPFPTLPSDSGASYAHESRPPNPPPPLPPTLLQNSTQAATQPDGWQAYNPLTDSRLVKAEIQRRAQEYSTPNSAGLGPDLSTIFHQVNVAYVPPSGSHEPQSAGSEDGEEIVVDGEGNRQHVIPDGEEGPSTVVAPSLQKTAGLKRSLPFTGGVGEPPAKRQRPNNHGRPSRPSVAPSDLSTDPFSAEPLKELDITEKARNRGEYATWRQGRLRCLKPHEEVTDQIVTDPAWWYAQVCLCCLSELQHVNLAQHLRGNTHRKRVSELRMRPTYTRKIPLLCNLGTGPIEKNAQEWAGHPSVVYVEQFMTQQFSTVCDFRPGETCLTLGEQDFSFTLAVARHLGGTAVVGTSFCEAYDPSVPEINIKRLDDGARRFHNQKTLQSMNGDLSVNLTQAKKMGLRCYHGVDATDIENTLLNRDPGLGYPELGPWNHVIFPFPRCSLKRGCDPSNSTLLRGFFRQAALPKVLLPNGLCQLVMLKNQFREWDVVHLAHEAGFVLRSVCDYNFQHLQYQPRDVTGNPINRHALAGSTMLITFRRELRRESTKTKAP